MNREGSPREERRTGENRRAEKTERSNKPYTWGESGPSLKNQAYGAREKKKGLTHWGGAGGVEILLLWGTVVA